MLTLGTRNHLVRLTAVIAVTGCTTLFGASSYVVTNLTSSVAGQATNTDTRLRNAWGLDKSPTGPWWVNSAARGLSIIYQGTGVAGSAFTIPTTTGGTPPSSPTGIVYNNTTSFQIATGKQGLFLFCTENGTLSGWNSAVNATTAVTKVDRGIAAVYKGMALGTLNSAPALYAANFRSGAIEVYDGTWNPINLAPGAFVDPTVPAGYGPFNVARIGSQIYVAWVQQDATQTDGVPGTGRVSVFNADGTYVRSLQSGTWFNEPWAIVKANSTFGSFANFILVGNFYSGTIAAFNPTSGAFAGFLKTAAGGNVTIRGLWGLSFGNNGQAGSSTALYFAAGTSNETQGLFGTITVGVPLAGSEEEQ